MAAPTTPLPCPRNYLLRVRGGASGPCYLVQDLRTGECREFATAGELRRFLAARGTQKRLR